MSDGTAKATRYTDQGVKVTVTKNDTEPAFTLSFTENPATLTFEEHASLSVNEGKRIVDGKHTPDHHYPKKRNDHSHHHIKPHDQKGNGHTEHQFTKPRSGAILGLAREMWNNNCGTSSSTAAPDTSLASVSVGSCEKTHQDSTKKSANTSQHTISLHISTKHKVKADARPEPEPNSKVKSNSEGNTFNKSEPCTAVPVEDQKDKDAHQTMQEQAEQESVPLDRHSLITGSAPSEIDSLFADGRSLVPSPELYGNLVDLHRSLLELEERSSKINMLDASEGSSIKMTHREFRTRRNKALLQACLSIEKANLAFLGTDMGARVYQPTALRKIYHQMDHGVEPTSISQERLILVRRTIRHDRHALNKMMGSEAKQSLKKTIYGNRMATFKLSDVITKTIVTAGTIEQPDITRSDLQPLQLRNYYPSITPSILLLTELEELAGIDPEEFLCFKATCSNMIAELGYVLNQVTESNSKATISKILSILSTYLVPQSLRFLAISLLVFCNCILEKTALERVFVPVYASIFSEIISSASLAKQLINSYSNFSKYFRKKCEERNITNTSERAYGNFMCIIFREIMELKLEDMIYNVDLEVPFFKKIELQQAILDRTTTGTIIQHSEQDQQCIRDYIKSLQNLYIVNLAVFAAQLYVLRASAFITSACLQRIFLNLVCYNTSYNYIFQTDTWAKYTRQPHFSKLYLPAVNLEINRLHTEKRYRQRIDIMKFSPDGYMPNYTLYEAAIAMLKIVGTCIRYYLVDKYSTHLKTELDGLLGPSTITRSKDSSKRTVFKSLDSLRQYLNDGELVAATSTAQSSQNYNILIKYLFANTELVHITFPFVRKVFINGDTPLYQVISDGNLEKLLWTTPDMTGHHARMTRGSNKDHEKLLKRVKQAPGAIMHALAEKIGVDIPALDVIRLFSEISNLYFHYLAPMQTDTVHVSHFRFLILELNEELESLFDKNLSDDRICRISFLTQLKRKLHSLMSTCKKHKVLTATRPSLISTPANSTGVPANALDIETRPHQVSVRKPILALPTNSDARKELLTALRTETLEASLTSALQCVLNLEYDQETGLFLTQLDTWSDILSELLIDTVLEAGTHTSTISAVATCIPDLLSCIRREVADVIPDSLWELLLDGALLSLDNEQSIERKNTLMNGISYMIITLIHKQVFNFFSIARDLASRARKEECAHKLGKAIVSGFLVAANEDDDSPSQKLLAVAKQNHASATSRMGEKMAVYELVNIIGAIYTRKPSSAQELEEIYNVLRENKALADVFSIYNVVVCENSVRKKELSVSAIFSQYLEKNEFLFRGDCIHNTFDIVCGIALSFVPSASLPELSSIFSELGKKFASQGIPLSTLAGHVFQRWKETVYCSKNFILIWNLLIHSKLCSKAAITTYIKSIPSFTDIKKQIQDSEAIQTWLSEE
ncbi:Hypothetical protein GLP15_2546 [Giardia lamblia P15]|uniref:Uncharacterized protein n=1 Tax=Giardia intestinalis (strain P15) TaxID=658858 RepID=E1EXE2_GIAIA|nr:Hypothetical protein GLP15_2546 [Giardia lamblia P15]